MMKVKKKKKGNNYTSFTQIFQGEKCIYDQICFHVNNQFWQKLQEDLRQFLISFFFFFYIFLQADSNVHSTEKLSLTFSETLHVQQSN